MGPKHAKNAREKASFSNAKKGAFPTSPADANNTDQKAVSRRTLLDVYAPPRGSTITDESGREMGGQRRERDAGLSVCRPFARGSAVGFSFRRCLQSHRNAEKCSRHPPGTPGLPTFDGQHRPAAAASTAANSRAAAAAAD
jgi:hypothetical protein